MSIHDDPGLSGDIWAGKVESVEVARARYEESPRSEFTAWVSTLYSFRRVPRYCVELAALALEIMERAIEYVHELEIQESIGQGSADTADVLSTVLLWLSGHQDTVGTNLIHATSKRLAFWGLRVAEYVPGEHTPALLATTYAEILMQEGEHYTARGYLRIALAFAPFIKKREQRARVWRRLGTLYLRSLNPMGCWYLARALLARGIPAAVRRKTLSFWK